MKKETILKFVRDVREKDPEGWNESNYRQLERMLDNLYQTGRFDERGQLKKEGRLKASSVEQIHPEPPSPANTDSLPEMPPDLETRFCTRDWMLICIILGSVLFSTVMLIKISVLLGALLKEVLK